LSLSLSPHLDIPISISTGLGTAGLDAHRLLSQFCDLAGHGVDGVEAAAVILVRHLTS
jgi:hypothetical protein